LAKTLQTIKEEAEHDQEGVVNMNEMLLSMSNSPTKRRTSMSKSVRGSFAMGDMESVALPPMETPAQTAEREKKELLENHKILSKEESQAYLQSKEFDEFIAKTGRIVERALDQEFDIVGDFFAEDDDDEKNQSKQKREKITQQFTF
jgi:hypothetical protein